MDDYMDKLVDVEPGSSVYGSDGEKLGSIVEIGPNYVVVEKGLFFPTDYFVPNDAIASTEAGRITLAVTRDVALQQGWEKDPTEAAVQDVDQAEHDPGFQGDFDGVAVTGFGPAAEGSTNGPVRSGFATEVGTTPPAADFSTLGVAPVDVNTAYTGEEPAPAKEAPIDPSKDQDDDADRGTSRE